mmetsp:Transcript_260/g.593  ORF Transcript_260/g.593 Transcript_260/m.593 type:complete len:337 (+) Transcript_260:962-1972(+)
MCNVTCHDEGASQAEAGADGALRQLLPDMVHGLVQVNLDDLCAQLVLRHFRQVLVWVALQLLQEQTLAGDLAHGLAISRAGYTDAHRARGSMARHANDLHIMAEVFAPKLRPDAHLACHVENLLLPFQVSECAAIRITAGGQPIQVPAAGHLHCLEVLFCAQAPNNHGQVVGGAGGCPQGLDLLIQECLQGFGVQQSLGLLVQHCLVSRATPLGNEEHFILVAGCSIQLNLGRQIAACVLFSEHVLWGNLRVPEVGLRVRFPHTLAEVLLILAIRPHVLPALAHDDGGASVLAARQHLGCCDVCILEQLQCHELVVCGGLRVIQDVAQLLQVAWSQ